MKHCVLLKFKDGVSVDEAAAKIRSILAPVPREIHGAGAVSVSVNCVDRAENLDLIIEIPMADKAVLAVWMDHTIHKEMIAYAGPKVNAKYTIDHQG
jgi:hypothetical protein